MKLLLTSAGITNQKIADALFEMTNKPASELKVAFIPTAANVEEGNKTDWFFRQYEELRQFGIEWINMIDFAAADVDWQARLEECDVLYLTGGNTFYLLDQVRRQGFDIYLEKALKEKVYVGGSASSILVTPSINVANIPPGDPNLPRLKDFTGLGYVDFEIEPHCDKDRFETVKEYALSRQNAVYALDDASAIKVIDGKATVVSEGEWDYFEGGINKEEQ